MSYAILYSFRRCPYAMRARLALAAADITVELREIVLRDKAPEFLAVSPTGTVPCLVAPDGTVIDESIDIMYWALAQNDPFNWCDMPAAGSQWITRADGPFKHALDRTKYASRYPNMDRAAHVATASAFFNDLEHTMSDWIFGHPTLADYALLPFVRQFAFIDKSWFDAQPWPRVHAWLEQFLQSNEFTAIMHKYPKWQATDHITLFSGSQDYAVER